MCELLLIVRLEPHSLHDLHHLIQCTGLCAGELLNVR